MKHYPKMLAKFTVPGSPCGFGERGVTHFDWMEVCQNIATPALKDLTAPLTVPVKFVCRFRVLKKARANDLDNMIKPLVDAVGAAGLFQPGSCGGRKSKWNTDDRWVYAIEAEKELVDHSPGTDVEIWWDPDRDDK